MYPIIAFTESFPAALLNQPGSRYFDRGIGNYISGNGRIIGLQGFISSTGHFRIFKEATGIADHRRIGQLGTAYMDHYIRNGFQAKVCNTLLFQFFLYITVGDIKVWHL
ncbi:hypothetical protein D3C86_1802100 [compost metagenome]